MGYDRREINHHWYESFDEKRMIVVAELEDGETDIPVKFEVCDVCNGKGSHVNPNIDSGGLSREDFDEDPNFRENYFSGMYDVSCVACNGKRVAIEPDYERMDKRLKEEVENFITSWFDEQRAMHREREMGY